MKNLFLASASLRRQELLTQIKIPYEIVPVHVDEHLLEGEEPKGFVKRLAQEKASAGLQNLTASQDTVVLGADTAVVLDNHIFGKPQDEYDAVAILRRLSGRTHEVYTAVCVKSLHDTLVEVVPTKVSFCDLSDEEISEYWASGEPKDKAGAYAIQGIAGAFIEKIEGSYSAVVGLPLYQTVKLLKKFGISS